MSNELKEEIVIELNKNVFKNLLNNLLKNKAENYCNNVLKDVLLEIEDDIIKFTATDADTLVNAEFNIGGKYPKFKAILKGEYLSKVKILKGWVGNKITDTVNIIINNDKTIIEDVVNGITWSIPYYNGAYPNYQELFNKYDNEARWCYAFNMNLLSRLKDIQTKPQYTKLYISKDNLAPIYMENEENSEIRYKALIMPCQIKEDGGEE